MRKVRIKLGPQDLSNVRFVFSPLWECVAAFRVWQDPARHGLFLPWISSVKSKLFGHDWEPLRSLASVTRGSIPDFLSPPPTTPLPELTDELRNLRSTPADIVRAELKIAYPRGTPRPLKGAFEDPKSCLEEVAFVLEKFWQLALAREWPVIRQKLEGEILFRARALSFGGPGALFQDVHRDVSYEGGYLTVFTDSPWEGTKRRRGMLLMPSVFSWPDVFLAVKFPWRPCITYPASGIAEIWTNSMSGGTAGLSALLGETRARVLLQLRTPQTTVLAARALRLSPASISEQIAKLRGAGLLERTRMGRRVFYSLNANGRALLRLGHRDR
jgi:hypothetical protein